MLAWGNLSLRTIGLYRETRQKGGEDGRGVREGGEGGRRREKKKQGRGRKERGRREEERKEEEGGKRREQEEEAVVTSETAVVALLTFCKTKQILLSDRSHIIFQSTHEICVFGCGI